MTDVIISISLYIIAAILLGFLFGWFIAKAIYKEKFDEQIVALSTNYEANRNTLDLDSKAQNQEVLKLKEELRKLKSKHDKELDAFLEEREDITMKYKALLDKATN